MIGRVQEVSCYDGNNEYNLLRQDAQNQCLKTNLTDIHI